MKFQWNINTAVIKCQDYAGWYASLSLYWNGEDRMAASFYKESMGIRHGESAFSEIWWNPGIFFFCCATCRFDHDVSNASRDSILQNKFVSSFLQRVSFRRRNTWRIVKSTFVVFRVWTRKWFNNSFHQLQNTFFFSNKIILFLSLSWNFLNFHKGRVRFFFFLENEVKRNEVSYRS